MKTNEIVDKILSCRWPSIDELVSFAINRHGFGGDDGIYGINYPSDLDDYDKTNSYIIPEEMVELSYWDGEIKEALVPEVDYLALLATYLQKQEAYQLATEIRKLVATCSSKSTE